MITAMFCHNCFTYLFIYFVTKQKEKETVQHILIALKTAQV